MAWDYYPAKTWIGQIAFSPSSDNLKKLPIFVRTYRCHRREGLALFTCQERKLNLTTTTPLEFSVALGHWAQQ